MAKGKFALGALFGAAVGIAAGILVAPKAGKETREDIKAKAQDVKHEATEKVDDAKTKKQEIIEDVEDKVVELKERAEAAVEGAKTGLKNGKIPTTKK